MSDCTSINLTLLVIACLAGLCVGSVGMLYYLKPPWRKGP